MDGERELKPRSPFSPILDTVYRRYADLLLRHHNLLLEGKESAPETGMIEDEMTELWERLDEMQRQSAKGMGSDLNWVRRRGEPPPKGRKAEEVTSADRRNLLAATTAKEWHAVLHYLRLCAPAILPANLAYFRASAYDAIAFPAYAAIFYQQAADFEPANGPRGIIALQARARTLHHAKQAIAAPVRYAPVVVAMSALMALRQDEEVGSSIDRERFAAIFNGVVERQSLEPPSNSVRTMVYQLVASGFEIIDGLSAALRCYEEGLKLSPDNEALLVGKGLLLYGSKTGEAVEAFKRVVRRGTSLVWPNFFLAHHRVLAGQYEACLQMSGQAWTRATTAPVQAELLEWQAICLSEMKYPAEVVHTLFEKAGTLDPSNVEIKRNLVAFDEWVRTVEKPQWDIPEASAIKVKQSQDMAELALLATT
jgi:hypothetical protein